MNDMNAKIINIIIMLTLLSGLAACGSQNEDSPATITSANIEDPINTITSSTPEINSIPPSTTISPPSVASVTSPAVQKTFIPEAPFVGEINGSYIDPEFSEQASQIVFLDNQYRLWIGDVDKKTGMFKTATGCDYLIDDNQNNSIPLIMNDGSGKKFSTNGPEWTRDNSGEYIVFTSLDKNNIMQQSMARLVNGVPEIKQLTHMTLDAYGNMPSRFNDGKPPRVSFTYDWPFTNAKAGWIFADKPDELHKIESFALGTQSSSYTISMWSAVSPEFLFIYKPPGAKYGQLASVNADTGKVTQITNDAGEKNDPGCFLAPEFGGEKCYLARIDNQYIGIYRDLNAVDGYWTRVATLKLPADSPHKYIFSIEIIASDKGIGGISYFALVANKENKERPVNERDRAIWILGLGTDENNRFKRRVDDGAISGLIASRMEPEPFIGTEEVFVYYNFYDLTTGKHGLRRASTGIMIP